jgi:hypothetical protein
MTDNSTREPVHRQWRRYRQDHGADYLLSTGDWGLDADGVWWTPIRGEIADFTLPEALFSPERGTQVPWRPDLVGLQTGRLSRSHDSAGRR